MGSRPFRNLRLLLLVCTFGCMPEPDDPQVGDTPGTFALTGVSVIDGRGGPALGNHTVVVQDGWIETVAPMDAVRLDGIREIEADGKFLIPGLWDLHAHTFAIDAVFDLYLAAGVTGLRDMGCSAECARSLSARREARKGNPRKGPRFLMSGPMLDGNSPYDGYPSHLRITSSGVASAISLLTDLEVDFVKVRDFLSVEEFDLIAEEAEKAGLKIAGHIPTAVPAARAAAAGLNTVEHEGSLFGGLILACAKDEERLRAELLQMMRSATGSGDVEALYAQALGAGFMRRLLDSFDSEKADDLAQSFLEHGVAVVPTFIVQDPRLRASDPVFGGRRLIADRAMRLVPDRIVESWQESAATQVLGQAFSEADRAEMARHFALFADLVGRFHEAGVPILAGTDAAFPDGTPWVWPGFSLHDELQLLVEAGLTPAEAIASATGKATAHLGLEHMGTIEPGKIADLVLLVADPLAEIGNTREISDVIVDGEFIDLQALRVRLETLDMD